QYLLEQGQGYRVRKQYEVIGIRAGYSNTAWIDFITTDDQCGGVHFKLAERLWGSVLTMKRANVSQEPLIARTRDAPTRERPGLGMGGDGLRGFGTCLIFWIVLRRGQSARRCAARARLAARAPRAAMSPPRSRDERAPANHSITSSARPESGS